MNTETDFPPTGDVRVRATAWALGQLTAAETEAFETEMALDADLAAYAQEMQQFCTLVSLELPPCAESRVLQEPAGTA